MSEPMGAGARADFVCLSKKCASVEGAPTYELPVAAVRCPVCSSKRIQRVWSGKAPGLIRSGMRDMQRVIDQAGSESDARLHAQTDAARAHEKQAREMRDLGVNTAIRMVPVHGVGNALASMQMGSANVALPAGKAMPSGMNSPLIAGTVAGTRTPTRIARAYSPTPDEMKKARG